MAGILTTNLNLTSQQLLPHPPGLEREFDALLQIFAWSRSTTTSWEVLKGRWTNQSWRNGTSTHRQWQLFTWREMRSLHPLKLGLRKPHITTIKDDNGDGPIQLHGMFYLFSQTSNQGPQWCQRPCSFQSLLSLPALYRRTWYGSNMRILNL